MFPELPEKLELGLAGEVTEPPVPETMLHEPVPTEGLFAARVVLVAQSVWSGPALDAVGLLVKEITTSSVLTAQGALEVVQRSV